MKIGNLDLGKKLFLAPMAEITDSSFRKICKEQGAGFTFTQMVSAAGVRNNNFTTLRYLSYHRSEKPIGVQVLGNDPEILGDAVKEIIKFKPDLIDLNCGCPVDKVVNNNLGAALIDDPRLIGRIVRKMADSSNGIPVSVKTRLGKDKNKISILIHARTRADKYESDVDLNWLRKVKETVNIPIVGNGSLFTPAEIKNMIDETGCDSVMIARGALGNPFIFSRFNQLVETGTDPGEPPVETVSAVLLKQLKMLEEEFGEPASIDKAKKNTIWYFKNFPGIEFLLKEVFSQKDLKQLRSVITEHTEKVLNGFYKADSTSEINKMFKKKVLFWLTEENQDALC
jgi:nifR3 family TIM-barrel protein